MITPDTLSMVHASRPVAMNLQRSLQNGALVEIGDDSREQPDRTHASMNDELTPKALLILSNVKLRYDSNS